MEDQPNWNLGRIYKKKIQANFFKLFYYVFMTFFGYSILHKLYYFPKELFGTGDMNKMWELGYPGSYYHLKPEYFDLYYIIGLAFNLVDLVWLLFIYELQNDFMMMLLHHLCTIGLISFSFLTNYSNIGCLILFLHDASDIFVYIARIILNTGKRYLILFTVVVLLVAFIYARIYVFGLLLISVYRGISWKWKWVTLCLNIFAYFLYIMHITWIFLISSKFYQGIFKRKYEDTASVKKK